MPPSNWFANFFRKSSAHLEETTIFLLLDLFEVIPVLGTLRAWAIVLIIIMFIVVAENTCDLMSNYFCVLESRCEGGNFSIWEGVSWPPFIH